MRPRAALRLPPPLRRGLALALILSSGLVLLLGGLALRTYLTPPDGDLPAPPPRAVLPQLRITTARGTITILYVEVAATAPTRARGLMGRPTLPPDRGMLFDFGMDTQAPFWMRDTPLPLSIAWVAADGRIIGLADRNPQTDTLHYAPGPYRFALEVPQGFFTAHASTAGAQITGPPLPAPADPSVAPFRPPS
jgi:uncharacterized membrane protein (UPF0127 family)